MIIEGNESSVRIWFGAPSNQLEAVECEIVVDYDGMDRIVGGEVLNFGFDRMPSIEVADIARYDANSAVLSFWLLDDPHSARQEVLRGRLLLGERTILGVEIPTNARVRAGTLQLFRNYRREC